jgi:hypothetical protein
MTRLQNFSEVVGGWREREFSKDIGFIWFAEFAQFTESHVDM